jgi:hypothetical protein
MDNSAGYSVPRQVEVPVTTRVLFSKVFSAPV